MSTLPDACKCLSNHVTESGIQLTMGKTQSLLILLSPFQVESSITDGCYELHISCPFPSSSHQACKAQQALSLEGGGCWPTPPAATWLWQHQLSSLPHELVKTCSAATPEKAREYCQGQKNTTTQVEKRLGKVRGLDTACSTQGLPLSAAWLCPSSLQNWGLVKGLPLMVAHHKLMFSHIAHATWTAFPLQLFLLAQFQTPFSSWHPVCDAAMKTVSSKNGIWCLLSRWP